MDNRTETSEECQIEQSFPVGCETAMALMKTSKIPPAGGKSASAIKRPSAADVAVKPAVAARAARAAGNGKALQQDKVAERIAAATEELASGLTQASAAAEELRRAMEQIAAGADEAAGASQEQLGAIKNVMASLTAARDEADTSRRRTEATASSAGGDRDPDFGLGAGD